MHISRVVQAGVERTAATIKSVNWSALPPRAAHRSGSENNGAGVGMSGQAWRVGDRRAVGDQAARAVDAAGEGRARHATTWAAVAGKRVGEQAGWWGGWPGQRAAVPTPEQFNVLLRTSPSLSTLSLSLLVWLVLLLSLLLLWSCVCVCVCMCVCVCTREHVVPCWVCPSFSTCASGSVVGVQMVKPPKLITPSRHAGRCASGEGHPS